MLEAGALSHGRDVVDIYSNSWGPFDEGFRVAGPRTMTKRALQDGISMVRGNILYSMPVVFQSKLRIQLYTGV